MTPRTPAVLIGLVLLLVLLLVPAAIPARALPAAAIMAGRPGDTSFRLGQDIADLARRFGIALEVVPSQGAPENVEALIRRPNTQLAIVPSHVLDLIAGDPGLQRITRLLRVVFPLHAEEVHVLARPEIATFADLQGRRVAVGAPNSGTLVTATLLLAAAGVEPAAELRIGGEEALTSLREGRIDAMIHIEGQPAALFKEGVAIEHALHLVPVDHPALRRLYPASVIPADTYHPWQPEEVPTVAPRAVLMTYDWMEPGYQAWACRLVGAIARIVAVAHNLLRRDGHPKWREVDLDAEVPGWERSPCVTELALGGPGSYAPGAPAPPRRIPSSVNGAYRQPADKVLLRRRLRWMERAHGLPAFERYPPRE